MLSELSNIAEKVNGPILFITSVCMVLLVGITATMIYFALRYSRRRNPHPAEVHGHTLLEVTWTVVPTLLAFGMFWYGWVGYKFMKSPPDDAMRVAVTGRMWSWTHEYENGVQTPDLRVPVDEPVRLDLESADVIHSYYIPAFKVKQDVVPGIKNLFLWFVPKVEGTYDVFCAEYCGLQHSGMLTKVHVISRAEFDEWYEAEGAKVAEARATLEAGAEADTGALAALGKQLATSKGCVACHSVDGTPLIGPTFKGAYGMTETVVTGGAERQVMVDDDYIRKSILDPTADVVKSFQPLMPSQEGLVTDQEIQAIIEYIKTLQ
ncbi:MAG: cytochrome c oxidase subunit II [Candidatus Krumholzibacteria bacterium]|nr:cytochrome c oxidase subunit II [Candidatus Krumholzibacteria bacterium]